jgi:hypothetical protein
MKLINLSFQDIKDESFLILEFAKHGISFLVNFEEGHKFMLNLKVIMILYEIL